MPRDSRSRSPRRDDSRGRGGGGRDGSRGRSPRGGRESPRRGRESPPRRSSRSGSRGRGDLTSEVMNLEAGAVAYLLGRNGATKQRLANFSGARLEIDPRGDDGGRVEIIGTEVERKLAKLCIDITLQQRNNGKVVVDLPSIESRSDISTLDVPGEAVGFVLGSKGATLREFETKYRTFMFFDNDNVRENKKRLYILGTDENRLRALRECENAVNYKLSGNGSLSSWRDKEGAPIRPRYDTSYRRSRSRSRDRGAGDRGAGDRGGYGGSRGGNDRGGGGDRGGYDRDRERGGYDRGGGGRDDRRGDYGRGGGDHGRGDRDRGGYDRRSPPRERHDDRGRSPPRREEYRERSPPRRDDREPPRRDDREPPRRDDRDRYDDRRH